MFSRKVWLVADVASINLKQSSTSVWASPLIWTSLTRLLRYPPRIVPTGSDLIWIHKSELIYSLGFQWYRGDIGCGLFVTPLVREGYPINLPPVFLLTCTVPFVLHGYSYWQWIHPLVYDPPTLQNCIALPIRLVRNGIAPNFHWWIVSEREADMSRMSLSFPSWIPFPVRLSSLGNEPSRDPDAVVFCELVLSFFSQAQIQIWDQNLFWFQSIFPMHFLGQSGNLSCSKSRCVIVIFRINWMLSHHPPLESVDPELPQHRRFSTFCWPKSCNAQWILPPTWDCCLSLVENVRCSVFNSNKDNQLDLTNLTIRLTIKIIQGWQIVPTTAPANRLISTTNDNWLTACKVN